VHVERDGNAARNIWLWALLRAKKKTEEACVDQEDSGGEIKKPPKKKRKKVSKQQPRYTLTAFGVRDLMASTMS